MLYIISVLLILAGFICKKSRIVLGSQFFFLAMLMGGNCENPDYLNYKYMFDNAFELLSAGDTREPVFLLINALGNRAGLSFQQFYFIFMTLTLVLLIRVIRLYTKEVAPVLSMFMLYPMVESTIQIRTFLAMVILLWAFRYLIDKRERFGTIKYIALVLIASLFHISFLFYLFFVFVRYLRIRDWTVIIQMGVFLLLILVPLLPYIFTFFMESQNTYFSSVSRLSIFKVLGMVLWQLSGMVVLVFVCKSRSYKIPVDQEFYKFVVRINMASCIILPLYFGGNTFMRLYRNIFLLNYIAVNSKKTSLFKGLYLLYIISTAVFFNIVAGNGFLEVFRPIFEKNVFLGF